MRWQDGVWILLGVVALQVHMTTGSRGMQMTQDEMLLLQAAQALRDAGNYSIIATSLQISADEILPPRPSTATFFAPSDEALKNLSLPSWLMMDLLHYHTSTDRLLSKTLSAMAVGSCIRTLLHGKNLVLTAVRSPAINGVRIAHPDVFTAGRLAVHGVRRPFFTFDPNSVDYGLGELRVTPCSAVRAKSEKAGAYDPPAGKGGGVSWFKAQAVLRSKGYIAFSVAIRLEETNLVLQKHNVSRVTMFAPSDEMFAYVRRASPVLAHTVRYHMVPRRLPFADLVLLPAASHIPTLLPGRHLQISSAYSAFQPLAINNVPILRPDLYSTPEFVIHGISRPFYLLNLTSNAH